LNNVEQVTLSPELVERIQQSTNEHLNRNGYASFKMQDGNLMASFTQESDIISF